MHSMLTCGGLTYLTDVIVVGIQALTETRQQSRPALETTLRDDCRDENANGGADEWRRITNTAETLVFDEVRHLRWKLVVTCTDVVLKNESAE